MAEELLRLEGLSKYYTSAQSVVMGLNSVSLSFRRGEFVAVTGESGSGKSTFAHVVGGILPYESGELWYRGKPTSHYDGGDWERYRRDHISFISQNYGILPGCTVLENVVSALRLTGLEKAAAGEKAEELLKEVELWELRRRRAGHLSSGQKQRLSIARALAKPAPILIADEPTGNLDPENSAAVIRLLARAARERLVILITHEFSEAQDYVTRHITIREGQVALDTVLTPAPEPEAAEPVHRSKQMLSPYVARLMLQGRPVWSALVLAFFALTAFAVFAFMGVFAVSLDDTDTRVYDGAAFLNGDRQRIVAVREDLGAMTEADLSAIVSAAYVEAVEKWGYVTDVQYAWQEGVDYKYKYSVQGKGDIHDFRRELYASVSVLPGAPYLRTVPLLPEGQAFLTAGRLPESLYEVVAAGDESLIGTTVPVFLQDGKNWSASVKIDLEVTVVGVTDYGSGLYFHEDLGRAFQNCFVDLNREWIYLYSEDLAEDQIRVSEKFYTACIKNKRYDFDLTDKEGERFNVQLICAENGNEAEELSPTHNSFLTSYWQVSPAVFDRLVGEAATDQVSVTIADYAYTDEVLQSLRDMGYIAVSPFREGSTKVDAALARERMQTLSICLAALAAVLVLQVLVLRALFSGQTEQYALLGSIGLVCPVAKRSVLWQIVLFTFFGQAVGLSGLLACASLGVERIARVLRYLPAPWLALFGLVHLAGALLAAWWIARAMSRQVFPLSGKEGDLEFDDGEVEA